MSTVTIGAATLYVGDCIDMMRAMPDNSVDSVVTDPPYEIGFMGKSWDSTGIANNVAMWAECLRVLKPGGHLLAFSATRTQHRMVCAIEDAGFEVRDSIPWIYGSGFPKSMNVSKAIDKAAGAERKVIGLSKTFRASTRNNGTEGLRDRRTGANVTAAASDAARQWEGWGTAIKPAHEPICLARKPLSAKTVAANVLAHGTGAINIDACRIPLDGDYKCKANGRPSQTGLGDNYDPLTANMADTIGRWPANIIHDGSPEVVALFPANAGAAAPVKGTEASEASTGNITGKRERVAGAFHADTGSAARFFYCPKTSSKDRHEGLQAPGAQFKHGETLRGVENTETKGNNHPTVKPTDLMAYLCRLVTPPGGTVLDPFMGSGSTGKAAMREGFRFIGCDLSADYVAIAKARIEHEQNKPVAPVARVAPVQLELIA